MGVVTRGVRQVRWSIATRGVAGTASLALRRLLGRDAGQVQTAPGAVCAFDVEHGVDTAGRIGGSRLGAGHAHDVYNTAYLGTPPSRFAAAIAQWRTLTGVRPVGEYAFFDAGCGKGRVAMLASGMGFREVRGVELDPELARVAMRNVEVWRGAGRARCGIKVTQGDVTEAPLPELPCVVFLFNPFRGPVMRKLLARLEQHAGERAGEMDVIYLIPNEAAEFAAYPRFRRMWEGMVAMSGEDAVWDGSDAEDLGQIWRR